jgi:hypothetical protein
VNIIYQMMFTQKSIEQQRHFYFNKPTRVE